MNNVVADIPSSLWALRHRTSRRPTVVRSGEPACILTKAEVEARAEFAMVVQLLTDRPLFGEVYRRLHPDNRTQSVPGSGVLVAPSIPTAALSSTVKRPGDIDVLAIPYEGDELLLGQTLAFEVKVIRASFAKQGKSPNEFGFSQALGLLEIGFPYVALVHLIVSDVSPRDAWETKHMARILDEEGHASELEEVQVDMLPAKLMDRAFHRLIAHSPNPTIGLASVYQGDIRDKKRGIWFPDGRGAVWNPHATHECLHRIRALYETNPRGFLATPRYDDHVPFEGVEKGVQSLGHGVTQ